MHVFKRGSIFGWWISAHPAGLDATPSFSRYRPLFRARFVLIRSLFLSLREPDTRNSPRPDTSFPPRKKGKERKNERKTSTLRVYSTWTSSGSVAYDYRFVSRRRKPRGRKARGGAIKRKPESSRPRRARRKRSEWTVPRTRSRGNGQNRASRRRAGGLD